MRMLALCLAALALSACGQNTAGGDCARSVTREVAWTNADAPDTITASASGPSCSQAVAMFVLRDAEGDPLWVHASTYYDMTAGGLPPPNAPPATDAQVVQFLNGWANVEVSRSNDLPEWRAGVATLTESATTFAYDTPFERATYEALRARNLPMLCFAAAAEAVHCLVIDPASHAPTMIAAYGP